MYFVVLKINYSLVNFSKKPSLIEKLKRCFNNIIYVYKYVVSELVK